MDLEAGVDDCRIEPAAVLEEDAFDGPTVWNVFPEPPGYLQ
ncbi:MAG TPA: hypothetical protein VFY54_04130 [Rubrobacter sp.]|nr:hypothetical protein [Rubrobacter sp.]